MIEPGQLLAALRAGHYHYISEAEMRCLALFALGYAAEDIAGAVAESAATVRRRLRRVPEAASARVGLDLSQDVFRTWVWCHTDECTGPIVALIGDEQILRKYWQPRSEQLLSIGSHKEVPHA